MYIARDHLFSTSLRSVDGVMQNIRSYYLDYKYTMNTLLGLYKVRKNGNDIFIDVESDYSLVVSKYEDRIASVEDLAATIWTGNTIEGRISSGLLAKFRSVVKEIPRIRHLKAQALAWAIIACLSCGEKLLLDAKTLADFAIDRYVHRDSHLVRHFPSGYRSDWGSFAASCYMAYSFLLLSRRMGDIRIRDTGIQIARKLVELQGPQGQWAWLYDVPNGRVADYYPVYSVHQHAMAPFFLLEAFDQGYEEFKQPLVKGFRWVLGENELGQKMVSKTERLIWRSAFRREPLGKLVRFGRALGVSYAGLKSGIVSENTLRMNRECRSYELGWALWAFSGRDDFHDILAEPCFS